MNEIETLSTHIVRSGRARPSDAAREAVRLHLVDTVGAWIAGTATPEGQALMRFRAEHRTSSDDSRMQNCSLDLATYCALARLSEIDDIHLASMITPGGIVIPGALTIAAGLANVDGAALTQAIIAGYDAMTRLGLALDGPNVLGRGMWPSYVAAPFAIAAVAARLLKLDEVQTAHALALALTLAAPGVGSHHAVTTARWFAIGNAARNGLAAALAAQAGFSSDLKILRGGFFPGVYNITPDLAALTNDFGARDTLAETSFKPWCAARQTMAATQALKEVLGAIAATDIIAITASVVPAHLKMMDHGVTAGDRASHLTSLPYQMARAAISRDDTVDVACSPAAIPEQVRSLMALIRIEADESLLAFYPRVWPARVRVKTHAGECERFVIHVPGDPGRPYDDRQIGRKFHQLTTPIIGEHTAAVVLRACTAVLEGGLPASLLSEIARGCAAMRAPQT